MQKLGSFIQTPRQGKRMLNIYHLLRVRRGMKIFEFKQFIQDNNDGEYRIVLILLALNIGYPKIAKHLFPIFHLFLTIHYLHFSYEKHLKNLLVLNLIFQ